MVCEGSASGRLSVVALCEDSYELLIVCKYQCMSVYVYVRMSGVVIVNT